LTSLAHELDAIRPPRFAPVRLLPAIRAASRYPSKMMRSTRAAFVVCALVLAVAQLIGQQAAPRQPDTVYLPTPDQVVAAMLRMANVGRGDVVYDLGSGDGRIPIAAVRDFGAARGVGIELDATRVLEANENARRAGVRNRVEFRQQDLFDTDLRPATVVTLYLGSGMNLKLRPKLLAELSAGTRVVSHGFDMGDWPPLETQTVDGRPVFLWHVDKR
jgi:hypothetical protein